MYVVWLNILSGCVFSQQVETSSKRKGGRDLQGGNVNSLGFAGFLGFSQGLGGEDGDGDQGH